MTSTPVPPDRDPVPGPVLALVPARELSRGTTPVPSAVTGVDWSGSAAEAVVGRLLGVAGTVDRLMVELVECLATAVESGASEDALGVAVELVLSQSGRFARAQRNGLLRAVATLVRMPGLRQAFRDGWVSWSQVEAIVDLVRHVDVAGRDRVDDLVAQQAHALRDCEADALVDEVDWLVAALLAARERSRSRDPVTTNRLVHSARLDGSGSSYAEWDADHFPLWVQSIDDRADDRHRFEAVPDVPGPAEPERDQAECDAALTAAHGHAARVERRNAGRRALAAFELVCGRDATTLAPLDPADAGRSGRPSVLLTCDVSTLLDGTTPAHLLTRLGGRITVTAATTRRFVRHGVDVRTVVLDECGEAVGYGRRRRHADGWLRDVIVARDLHDTFPCSTTAGVVCDVDHVRAWEADGPTDAPNLTLLSRRAHVDKTAGRWRLARHPDGSRTWTANPSAYTIRQPRPPHLPRPPDLGPSP